MTSRGLVQNAAYPQPDSNAWIITWVYSLSLSFRSKGENASWNAAYVMEFLMKPVGRSRLIFRKDHFSIAPGAANKSPRILSFARIAGKGSHEG
jgi:hypothetical protein